MKGNGGRAKGVSVLFYFFWSNHAKSIEVISTVAQTIQQQPVRRRGVSLNQKKKSSDHSIRCVFAWLSFFCLGFPSLRQLRIFFLIGAATRLIVDQTRPDYLDQTEQEVAHGQVAKLVPKDQTHSTDHYGQGKINWLAGGEHVPRVAFSLSLSPSHSELIRNDKKRTQS